MRQTAGLGEVIEFTKKFTFNPKEGIDNPAMVISDTECVLSPTPRLCVLKREEAESFGFHLRLERGCRGHVIRQVSKWGVAERSGLRDGDRLLEVNEGFVDGVPHEEVARRIKMSGAQLCVLVLGGAEYEQALSEGGDLRALGVAHRGEGVRAPRLYHITRDTDASLGVSFMPVEGEKGRFSVSVTRGGPAEKAGVCQGDRLVWMNGATVSDFTHSALNKMVKKCGDHMTVLVIDEQSGRSYARRGVPVLPVMVDAHNMPHPPLRLRLLAGPEGYGFLLRQERTPSGGKVHVIREVDRGSPAEEAGVQGGDLLLEVNWESVETLGHRDVVDRVRQSGQEVTITTITARGLDFYTQLGLSPLIFCEGDDSVKEKERSASPTPDAMAQVSEDSDDAPSVRPGPQVSEDAPSGRPPGPRLCVLRKGPLGFGFNLGCVPQAPGSFISQVALGGSAHAAGLKEGDVVMEVNGQNVEKKSLEDVIVLVREGGHCLSLLVMKKNDSRELKQSRAASTDETELRGSEMEGAEDISAL